MDKSFPHLAHLHLKSGHFKEKCIFLRSQIRFFKQTPEHAERNATSHNPYTHLGRKKNNTYVAVNFLATAKSCSCFLECFKRLLLLLFFYISQTS